MPLFDVKTSFTGDKKLDRMLREFEPKLAKKIIRRTLRKAAKPVLETARQHAPVLTGALKRSLKVRAMKRSRRNKNKYGVRVITGDDFFKGEQFYGAFIEFGTSRIEAKPYLRPAYDNNKTSVRDVFRREIKKEIEQTARGAK